MIHTRNGGDAMKKFTDVIHRIELVQKENGMSSNEFASAINISEKEYREMINGHDDPPNVELIPSVVMRYGIQPSWLLNGLGPMKLRDDDSDDGPDRNDYN